MAEEESGAGVTPTGRLVAAKVEVKQLTETEQISLHDSIIAEVQVEREVTAVRIADDTANDVAADIESDGSIVLRITGKASLGEAGALRAAQTLVAHLNANGASWSGTRDVRASESRPAVDCEAFDPHGLALQMQVVRADVTQSLWAAVSQGRVEARYHIEELTDLVWKAIERKRLRAGKNIVLLLDAGVVVSHSFERVARELQSRAQLAGDLGTYEQVWLVGPTANLVWRLDSGAA